jgi:hypothetical protein
LERFLLWTRSSERGRDTKDVEMTIKILLLMALMSAIAASSYFRGSADLSKQENS